MHAWILRYNWKKKKTIRIIQDQQDDDLKCLLEFIKFLKFLKKILATAAKFEKRKNYIDTFLDFILIVIDLCKE